VQPEYRQMLLADAEEIVRRKVSGPLGVGDGNRVGDSVKRVLVGVIDGGVVDELVVPGQPVVPKRIVTAHEETCSGSGTREFRVVLDLREFRQLLPLIMRIFPDGSMTV
jgi:hypothetical protein